MKKLFFMLAVFTMSACGDSGGEVRTVRVNNKRSPRGAKSDTTKVKDTAAEVQTIIAQQGSTVFFSNNYKQCKYPDLVSRVLETKLQYEMENSGKPREFYSDWFYQLHIASKTDSTVINFIDNAIDGTVKYLAKNMQFNYQAFSGQDTTAKVFMKK